LQDCDTILRHYWGDRVRAKELLSRNELERGPGHSLGEGQQV
jgi:hypothetical protein